MHKTYQRKNAKPAFCGKNRTERNFAISELKFGTKNYKLRNKS